jgi:para-nitrobenzyl esterase
MPLVFQQFGLPGRPQENASDRAMSEIITQYWTNFAKTGDPNGPGLPDWPAYSNARPQAMHFLADTAHTGPVVHEEGLRGLDAYFEWRRTQESPAGGVQEK